jgi:hypothetical protein
VPPEDEYPEITERAKIDMLRFGLSTDEVAADFIACERRTDSRLCASRDYLYLFHEEFFLQQTLDDVIRLGEPRFVIDRIISKQDG